MNTIEKITDKVEFGIKIIVMILTAALVSMVFAQVVLRYAFSGGIIWIEELERYTFVWLMFLGIVLGLKRQKHIAVTIVIEKIEMVWKYADRIPKIINLIFFGFLTVISWNFMMKGFSGFASVLPISLGYVYLIIPCASAMGVIFTIFQIVKRRGDKSID